MDIGTGANRAFVAHGLEVINSDECPVSIRALHDVSDAKKPCTTGTLGFQICPRINAAGRMDTAETAIRLLLTDDEMEAVVLAKILDGHNRDRQEEESATLAAAVEMIEAIPDFANKRTIVLASDTFHPGVIGICGSKVIEIYHRPIVMIAICNGVGKGSCRSIPAFNIKEGLEVCTDHLIKFGGHKYAAGLSIDPDNIAAFAAALEDHAQSVLTDEDMIQKITIDTEVDVKELTYALVAELDCLAPYGIGNATPVIALKNAKIVSSKILKEKHIKMNVATEGGCFEAIWFGQTEVPAGAIDIAFTLGINVYFGKRSLQLMVKDIRPAE